MALVSQSIKNLKGGVSQQPDILRYPEQGAKQVNGWSSETEGLQKRPPVVLKKVLGDAGYLGSDPMVHLINRDENEQYYVVFTGTGIRVFALDGTERTVRGDFSYVTTGNPQKDLRMITVADYTFVVNTTKTVEVNDGSLSNGGNFQDNVDGLINVRGGQYGRKLVVTINGTTVEHQLPSGSNATEDPPKVDAQAIAEALAVLLRAALPSWTFDVGTGYIHVQAPSGTTINEFITKDGYADQLISPVTHYAQSFSKLPLNAPDGYLVKIVGDTSKTADQYYVKYDKTQKVWKETIGWNVTTLLHFHTMPWALVRAADGQFDFNWHNWEPRKAGDDVTSPHPSLVGSQITDVFFWRNRLGFLSGENVVLSRTGRYFDLYPPSVANLSDDDPIDVAISHNRVSILKYAVPFAEELLLWSDEAQFVMSASGVLSAKSVELNLTTQFDVQDGARPYGIGRNIYFASKRATYSSVYRYYAVADVSEVKNAEDITTHIPQYIPNGIFSINGSGTENFCSVLTKGSPNKIFTYKFLYIDEQIRQQAWSHWEFPEDVRVLAADSIGSTMFLLLKNHTHSWLGQVDFTKDTTDLPNEPYRLYLDHKKEYTIPSSAYNWDTNETTITLSSVFGMTLGGNSKLSMVEEDGKITTWDTYGSTVSMIGDYSGKHVFFGVHIPFTYEFSKFLIKKTDEYGSTSTEDSGRLQLRRAWVNYEDSGQFTVSVQNLSRTFEYDMGGNRIGSDKMVLGKLNLGTGQYRFPVVGNARVNTVTIYSEAPTPLNIIGCGWEGNYTRRTSGI